LYQASEKVRAVAITIITMMFPNYLVIGAWRVRKKYGWYLRVYDGTIWYLPAPPPKRGKRLPVWLLGTRRWDQPPPQAGTGDSKKESKRRREVVLIEVDRRSPFSQRFRVVDGEGLLVRVYYFPVKW